MTSRREPSALFHSANKLGGACKTESSIALMVSLASIIARDIISVSCSRIAHVSNHVGMVKRGERTSRYKLSKYFLTLATTTISAKVGGDEAARIQNEFLVPCQENENEVNLKLTTTFTGLNLGTRLSLAIRFNSNG